MHKNIQNTDINEWLTPHFRQLLDDGKRLHTLVRLSINGITALTVIPRIGEEITRLEQQRGIVSDPALLETTKAEAELARAEVASGFAITLSQHLVDLWGLLEASVRNLVALWLEHMGGMKCEAVTKLKVRIGDYENLEGPAKFQYVVKLLEREEASSIKNGADRFESLLACVGLGGPIPKNLRRALYELSQLRNCIVHNARRADSQLTNACPWLNLTPGELISPGQEKSSELFHAIWSYSLLLVSRASTLAGDPKQDVVDEVFAEWDTTSGK